MIPFIIHIFLVFFRQDILNCQNHNDIPISVAYTVKYDYVKLYLGV